MRTLLLGMFGALLPELLRLYRARNSPISFPRSYFVISVAYFLASGVLVLVLPGEKPSFTAVYLGASSDYLITGLSKHSLRLPSPDAIPPAEGPEVTRGGDVAADDIVVRVEQPKGKRLLYTYLDLL